MYKNLIEGISVSIYNEFGDDVNIYADDIAQGFKEPCFFIDFINNEKKENLNVRHNRKYHIDIRYHNKISSIADKANIGEILSDILELVEVDIEGEKYLVRGFDISYKIVDYVLHFFISYDLVFEKNVDSVEKMRTISSRLEVDYGN